MLHTHAESITWYFLHHLFFYNIFLKIGGGRRQQLCKNSFSIFGNFSKSDILPNKTSSRGDWNLDFLMPLLSFVWMPHRMHCFQKKQLRKKCKSPNEKVWCWVCKCEKPSGWEKEGKQGQSEWNVVLTFRISSLLVSVSLWQKCPHHPVLHNRGTIKP